VTIATPRTVPAAPATVPPVPALALDIAFGERDAARCAVCNRHLPAVEHPKFELENAETGQPLCDVCANRNHHGLRLATALLNAVVEAYAAGDKKAADEAIRGLESGIGMLRDAAPAVPYQRPVRQQPTRRQSRRERRK
jgi:hypothetical protein